MSAGHKPGGVRAGEAAVPLDFDAWADLSARLLHRETDERIDILDAEGLTLKDWARCDKHHTMALAKSVAKGRMEQAESYGRKCAAEMARRRQEESKQAAHADAEAKREDASPVAEPAPESPAPAAELSVPSFLHEAPVAEEAPAANARRPIPKELSGTLMADSLPTFAKRAPANPLPFGDVPSTEFVASLDAPKPAAPASAGATIGLGVDLMSQVRAVLPFAGKEAATVPLGEAGPGATAALDPAMIAQAGALPFPAAGAAKPSRPRFPRLPLQTYASLCTELDLYPEQAAETLKKYGVHDEEARRALDQDWQARLAAHPDTREEWAAACKTYREWLLRQPRGA